MAMDPPSGTKKPMRMFYIPLEMGAAPVPECWFAYPKSAVKIPHSLKLQRVPGGIDCGGTGVYNHNEFILKLLSLQSANAWEIAECQYDQWSLCDISIIGIAERLGRPGQAAAEPPVPAASSCSGGEVPQEEIDWSIFDAPSLLGGNIPAFFPDAGVADDGSGNTFFFDDEDEFVEKEVDSDHELLAPDPLNIVKSKDPASDAESEKSAKTHASAASASGKTMATDLDILKKALGSRPESLQSTNYGMATRICFWTWQLFEYVILARDPKHCKEPKEN